MRSIEKLIGQTISSVIILIIGFMIISELVKQSELLQSLSSAFYILFVIMLIVIGIKIFDYFRKQF